MRGFTLVELMVALVVGLIVVLAAVGFVVSVAKANSENIQVTRLTQELRSLSEVMARELRRARYVADPVGLIGSAGTDTRDAITVNAAKDCIVFGYDEPPNPPAPAVTVARSIRLVGNDILLNPGLPASCVDPTLPAATIIANCCTGGSALNSPQVQIVPVGGVPGLQLENIASPSSRYDITVAGRLTTPPPGSALYDITRTFRQTVYVRSGQVD